MKLRTLTPQALERVYQEHLREAFPPAELKPLEKIQRLQRRGAYEPLCLAGDAGNEQGYIFLWKHPTGQYFLIDYLCVPAALRCRGIGGRLLDAVRARYPADAVLIAESEAPTGDPARDEMILRRLAFYRRSGARLLDYDCALFGVHYKCVCWAEPMPEEDEVLRHHQEIYTAHISRDICRRFIQLPLAPGEQPQAVTDWTED